MVRHAWRCVWVYVRGFLNDVKVSLDACCNMRASAAGKPPEKGWSSHHRVVASMPVPSEVVVKYKNILNLTITHIFTLI